MSLLEELESRGVTAEDLEKAASVRLFEKAAAAEGVDLDSLDVDQVEELYTSFLTNQSDDYTKEASAMNDEIVDLFEKTAAAEGIDLDMMADDELAELYNHYVDNVLPLQIEEYEKEASYEQVDDAHEKLAEAEILGRHMARAYMDEMWKEAAVAQAPGRFEAMKQLKAQGLSTAEAKAKVDSMMNAGKSPELSRKAQVKATQKRLKRRKKNPRGTQAPKKSGMAFLADAEKKVGKKVRRREAEGMGAKRVQETREAARKYVTGKYRGARSAVGKRQIQLGRLLGGTTRDAARLRGGLGMAGGALAAGAAGYGGYRALTKQSSFDDFDILVDEFENILLDKVADYDYDDDDDDSLESLALETALENLYDAGIDLDEL